MGVIRSSDPSDLEAFDINIDPHKVSGLGPCRYIHRYKSQIDISKQYIKLVSSRDRTVSNPQKVSTNGALVVIHHPPRLCVLIDLHLPHKYLVSHPQIVNLFLDVLPMLLLLLTQLQKQWQGPRDFVPFTTTCPDRSQILVRFFIELFIP
jgi:hypothetical protein